MAPFATLAVKGAGEGTVESINPDRVRILVHVLVQAQAQLLQDIIEHVRVDCGGTRTLANKGSLPFFHGGRLWGLMAWAQKFAPTSTGPRRVVSGDDVQHV